MTDEEVVRYKALYSTITKDGSNVDGVTAIAEAIIRSPFALFRSELGESGKTGNQRLTNFELAQALSYALTNAPPDDELTAKAKDGTLSDDKVYLQEAKRLLASESFVKGFTDYVKRWSGTYWMDSYAKDAGLFPSYKAELREAMIQEIGTFSVNAVKKNASNFKSFLTSDKTTITPPLASLYGLPAFDGSKDIDDSHGQRSGILTLPGVIAAQSDTATTGPMHRAIFLLSKLLCYLPPPPPDQVGKIPDPDPNLTLRDRFKAHATESSCKACHALMDPYAFALENYDPIGSYRTKEGNKAIDASGTLVLTESNNTDFKDAVDMLSKLSSDGAVHSCFVKNAFRYVNGRSEVKEDKDLLNNALANFKKTDLDMTSVFLTLVTTESFKTRKDGNKP